jgi:hypothetical protein
MPSSAVHTFTDPDDYAAAIRQGTYELTVTQRGDFTAKLTRIDLHRLCISAMFGPTPRSPRKAPVCHIFGISAESE